MKGSEAVTIKSKNYPDYRFGIHDDSTVELYIVNEHIVPFLEINPGLSGDPDSGSFQSTEDGKYIYNSNIISLFLRLEDLDESC